MSTHDKRELLKLKQGLIEDSEIIKKEEPEIIELHGKKKLENFWYHYKVHVLIILFFGTLITFFTIETIMKKKSDLDFLIVASTRETGVVVSLFAEEFSNAVAKFTPNFDGNGYVHAQPFPVNISESATTEGIVANQTKLFAEIQMGRTRMIIGDMGAFEHILGGEGFTFDEAFVNLSRQYPDNESIVDNVFFRVKGSEFSKLTNVEEYITDDFYIAVLALNLGGQKQEQAHERTLEVLDNIVNDRPIN
ncbi:MAG: hypothetical protein FWG70_03130 [Oscillospiraceae bacterium]|nr:hypothetical protein [Oscillospiraceae bacterium]